MKYLNGKKGHKCKIDRHPDYGASITYAHFNAENRAFNGMANN